MVKCAERSGSPIEIVPTDQWFVKLVDKKDRLKEKINECKWFPEYMKVRAEQWNESLSWDWCISRQRYFGVPFPVWYVRKFQSNDEWKTIVANNQKLPVNPMVTLPEGFHKIEGANTQPYDNNIKYCVLNQDLYGFKGSDETIYEVKADIDVMDTWATSSVSPQLSSKAWVNPERHAKLFPADMRPQAHEIIRTWAYYTIVKAHLHENTIPWKNVVISGWCLAEDKSKMSKSKGNVITPVPMVEAKSADVVRYWTSTSSLGADTAYSEKVLDVGKKLINKLWNVCKFASVNLHKLQGNAQVTEVADKWILTKLNKVIAGATAAFEVFEYSRARQITEDFFWKDFCDNYLEIAKARSYGETCSEAEQQSALITIKTCVEVLLKLWAPFVPHITEELNAIIFDAKESIHARGNWPKANLPQDEAAEKLGDALVEALEVVRKYKSDRNISIKFPIKKLTVPASLKPVEYDLKTVTSSNQIEWNDSATTEIELEEAA
jgi:valyl-tRNA synthetase